jgi:hypothetical protein
MVPESNLSEEYALEPDRGIYPPAADQKASMPKAEAKSLR